MTITRTRITTVDLDDRHVDTTASRSGAAGGVSGAGNVVGVASAVCE